MNAQVNVRPYSSRLVPRALLAITLLGATAGCSFLRDQAFAPPIVSVVDVRLSGFGMQGGVIDVVMTLHNPNNFRIDAEALHYKVLVDSTVIGEGTIEKRVSLLKRDSTSVKVPVTFGMREIFAAAGQLAQRGTLPFQVTGDIKMLTPFGSVTRKFEEKGTYNGVSISLLRRNKKTR